MAEANRAPDNLLRVTARLQGIRGAKTEGEKDTRAKQLAEDANKFYSPQIHGTIASCLANCGIVIRPGSSHRDISPEAIADDFSLKVETLFRDRELVGRWLSHPNHEYPNKTPSVAAKDYLLACLRNQTYSEARKADRGPVLSPSQAGPGLMRPNAEGRNEPAFDLFADPRDPGDAVETAELVARTVEKLQDLRPDLRKVLEMYYLDDATYQQVACELGFSLGTAVNRVREAKAELRRLVDQQLAAEYDAANRRGR